MKNSRNHTIPLHQVIFFVIFLFLIFARLKIANENLVKYVNIVNYISMIVSLAGIWIATLCRTKGGRNNNICKAIFVLIIVILVFYGCWILFFNKAMSNGLNDVFTLAALMFCICNIIFEKLIIFIFRLEYR